MIDKGKNRNETLVRRAAVAGPRRPQRRKGPVNRNVVPQSGNATMTRLWLGIGIVVLLAVAVRANAEQQIGSSRVAEIALVSEKTYHNPFQEIELDAMVTQPDGSQLRGAGILVRQQSVVFPLRLPNAGADHVADGCSDTGNPKLHGVAGKIQVVADTGDNPLYRHGPIRVAKDRRHFEHADGTPFFWLGDTWWKGLCKRLTWEGFQELAADRRAKGFTVVQIVCGVYPDEGPFQPRWENEGGKPYQTRDFSVVNPAYFQYADRRIKHLVDAGIVPAIVGGWGRADCDGMRMAGVAGIKRHWRNLIAAVRRLSHDLDHRRRIGRAAVDRGGKVRPENRSLPSSGDDPSRRFGPKFGHRSNRNPFRHAPNRARRLGSGTGGHSKIEGRLRSKAGHARSGG